MGQARRRARAETPQRAEAKRRRKIVETACRVGVPEIRRDPDTLVIETTAIVDGHTRPDVETVRLLGRIEQLQRARSLSAHEAAACQWYADKHALGQDTIGAVAGQHFELARTQACARTGTILRLCANQLGALIAHLLPIEPPALAARADLERAKAEQVAKPEPVRTEAAVRLFLDAKMLLARARGEPGAIRIARPMLDALRREEGPIDSYADLPLLADEGWSWGATVITADELALAAIAGDAGAGTDRGTVSA